MSDERHRVNLSAVQRAIAALMDLVGPGWIIAPQVVPTSDGGVQLEWHQHGADFELHVPPSGPIGYLLSTPVTDIEGEVKEEGSVQPLRALFDQLRPAPPQQPLTWVTHDGISHPVVGP